MATGRASTQRLAQVIRWLWRFGWTQVQCCAFAAAIFVGLAATVLIWRVVEVPVARYDVLLAYVLVVQVVFVATRLETGRELLVICCFHLLGLALEMWKTHVGSWSYPDPGLFTVMGVPLFSGFMYAAVGSYICQAFRRFDLRIDGFRWLPQVLLAAGVYLNFFTNAFALDLRVFLAIGIVVASGGTWVRFRVGERGSSMPLAVAFVLIGGFLWVAENLATLFGAWQYPYQAGAWTMVHVNKFGSWALLVTLSFVLVAAVKAREGVIVAAGRRLVHEVEAVAPPQSAELARSRST
ncbi:DUF817 domain-containing protein [Aestuariimicrobium ganziense]|uniref:DUF817 domain-containing protein n=1 Tax=Aestuariimicrobium ganziense TaxID=2773677 RepID=UPI001F3C849E|nr:DUF817 domain-containing protein [Aestuariimicrobium ganziense]